MVYEVKGGPDTIWDLAFNKADSNELWSAGVKAVIHFNIKEADKSKGMFGSNDRCSFAAITADDQGCAYAASSKGNVYVWTGNKIKTIYSFHDPSKGFCGSVMWSGGKLYSGGSDGTVKVVDTATGECLQGFDFGSLPRAIDVSGDNMVVGLRTGSIIEVNLADSSQTTYMQSHNSGEVWGLDLADGMIWTTGDDNQVMQWNPSERTCVSTNPVSEHRRKARRNRASTLSKYADSQCSRCIAVNKTNGDVATGGNDGAVTIRNKDAMGTGDVKHELKDSKEWVEVAEYSPCGKYLAIGSHDTNIRVYDVEGGYSLAGTCSKHNATVTALDWSVDSTYIRSVCNGYEILFFQIPDCSQDGSGASNTKGMEWCSHHVKFGWLVTGIFPKEVSGDHINGVDMNEDATLIATGDDFGLVNIFRNPARKRVQPRSYRGHSEHVVRVKFGRGDLNNYLFSVGGYDQTVMQWLKQ
jgi:WD40 repeat protein